VTDKPLTYLRPECRKGTCDCKPGGHMYRRSRQCDSGECTHARNNLHCREWRPTTTTGETK
jgi:hypothetical protein